MLLKEVTGPSTRSCIRSARNCWACSIMKAYAGLILIPSFGKGAWANVAVGFKGSCAETVS